MLQGRYAGFSPRLQQARPSQFVGGQPLDTGRPSYHPSTMLKLCIYGYLNRIPSSRRLERECQSNIEMIWLTLRLAPGFRPASSAQRARLQHEARDEDCGPRWIAGTKLLVANEMTARFHRIGTAAAAKWAGAPQVRRSIARAFSQWARRKSAFAHGIGAARN
jgi:transposase-like protein DUF772